MFQRGSSAEKVRAALQAGEEIEQYPEDYPFPSCLVLGWVERRPLHVVAGDSTATGETIIITVYEPDTGQWEPGFKKRKVRP